MAISRLRIHIHLATDEERSIIYRLRHEVYARELRQHQESSGQTLRDALDDDNLYIVATIDETIAGFVSITRPEQNAYSFDKYLSRDETRSLIDDGTHEVRILTVLPPHRGSVAALLLMYAAFRWIEAAGGTRVIALGRREVRSLYARFGLEPYGRRFESGSVEYVLMSAVVSEIRRHLGRRAALAERLEKAAEWGLIVPFRESAGCFHGGASVTAIGDEFDQLEQSSTIITADVLDAWFPPSPRVVDALGNYLSWLVRTSPPTGCEGMIRTIARTRELPVRCLLPGAGSSALIFLALHEWLTRASRVVLPEPAYGEYAHVLEAVVGCRIERMPLLPDDHYRLDLARLWSLVQSGCDMLILVNPNSPTGQHVPRAELEPFLRRVPASTLVWIDETYVEYAGADQSLERFATTRTNIVICKSMSKVYALSGLRCAYLAASAPLLERLRALTPPWAVSLPGQVAAVAALDDPAYYAEKYRETASLRHELAAALSLVAGLEVIPGIANFLLCHLPESGPAAAELVQRCRHFGLYLRDTATMGSGLGREAVRIAVKDRSTLGRMIDILHREEVGLTRAGGESPHVLPLWSFALEPAQKS